MLSVAEEPRTASGSRVGQSVSGLIQARAACPAPPTDRFAITVTASNRRESCGESAAYAASGCWHAAGLTLTAGRAVSAVSTLTARRSDTAPASPPWILACSGLFEPFQFQGAPILQKILAGLLLAAHFEIRLAAQIRDSTVSN